MYATIGPERQVANVRSALRDAYRRLWFTWRKTMRQAVALVAVSGRDGRRGYGLGNPRTPAWAWDAHAAVSCLRDYRATRERYERGELAPLADCGTPF